MAENTKRYYWLKLKDDFFRDKRIKKLRLIAGGDTYTIIYLKMQLLSLQNNGILVYEGVEDTFAKELALELDEEVENVNVTLAFLKSNFMIEETEPSHFLMTETIKCIGSECASAERVRKHRALKEEKQDLLQCNTDVTKCNLEIDKEKEKDIDINNTHTREEEFVTTEVLYDRLLAIVKEYCPIVYERHMNFVNNGNLNKAREVFDLLDYIYKRYTKQELIDLFKHADKTYVALPKYSSCDLVWVLNQVEYVKQLKEISITNTKTQPKKLSSFSNSQTKTAYQFENEREYTKEEWDSFLTDIDKIEF